MQVSSGGGASGPDHAGGSGGRDNEMNNACMMYELLHANPPDWGERGGNKEQTHHILCCRSDAIGVIVGRTSARGRDVLTGSGKL